MKIDFVVNSLSAGGAQRVLITLANYFDYKGHDVSIITFNNPEVFSANSTVKRIRLHDGKIKNHTSRNTINLIKLYLNPKKRPDIIMSFMTQTNFISIMVGKIYRIKVVSAEHNNHKRETDFIGRLTRDYMYRISDALTVLTTFDENHYKQKNIKTYVMPNPCTFEIYRETHRERKRIILAVGDLDRYYHKGFDNLIPLIAPVLKENTDWVLKFVGGGEEGLLLLKKLAVKYNVLKQIVFEGYSTNVAELMKESDIYVMSSRTEGLPMVLIEAFSKGMACISFDCITGPSEIIEHNINGLLIENQNFDAMAEGIHLLIKSPELRLRLAKASVNSLEKFKLETIYNNYLDIFEQLIKS